MLVKLPLLDVKPFAPSVTRAFSLEYASKVLSAPLFHIEPVNDVIGLPYGTQLTIEDGFYVTVASYLVFRTALRWILRNDP